MVNYVCNLLYRLAAVAEACTRYVTAIENKQKLRSAFFLHQRTITLCMLAGKDRILCFDPWKVTTFFYKNGTTISIKIILQRRLD